MTGVFKGYHLCEAGWKSNSGFSYETVLECLGFDVSGFSIYDYILDDYGPEILAVLGVDDIRFTVVEEYEDRIVEYAALWLSDVFDLDEDKIDG